MSRLIKIILLIPCLSFALPSGFLVNNQTDMTFSTQIGSQSGLTLFSGKELLVPFGPMKAKCKVSKQNDVCLLNIFNSSNNDLVAIIPFNPNLMSVVSAPEMQAGYDNIIFDGWDTASTVENILVYQG